MTLKTMTITIAEVLLVFFIFSLRSWPQIILLIFVFRRRIKHDAEVVFRRCSVKKKSLMPEACNFIKKRDSGTGVFLWILQNF